MSEPTAVQLQILRSRFPQIGEPALRRNWATLLFASDDRPVKTGPTKLVAGIVMPDAAKKRIRQSTKPVLNALESRYHAKLLAEYPGHLILCQAVRLELARGIWYKPDLFIPNADGHNLFFEVKGPKAFRGGFENLKVAARVHRWAKFFLVWEDERKVWQSQHILP